VTDYAAVLTANYAGSQWTLDNNDYATLQWHSDTPKPTQAELDAAWPQVNYANLCAQVENTRRTSYEKQSDGLFFEWQRGDGTEAAWRQAVAAIKAANPYPPAPKNK
jgi:hypothetical protein